MTWSQYQPDGTLKTAGDGVPPAGVVCSVYAGSNGAATTGWRKVVLDTKLFDPYAWFDTSNNRFLPKQAGYYRASGLAYTNATSGEVAASFYKNGNQHIFLDDRSGTGLAASMVGRGSGLVYLNGTTDYIEFFGYTGSSFLVQGGLSGGFPLTHFEVELVGASVGIVPEPWHIVGATGEPAFTNAWANYGSPYGAVEFFKDPNNIVHLSGSLKSGTLGTSAFTLPVGYRPGQQIAFGTDTAGNTFGAVEVLTSGAVIPTAAGAVTFISVAPVTFRAEQ